MERRAWTDDDLTAWAGSFGRPHREGQVGASNLQM